MNRTARCPGCDATAFARSGLCPGCGTPVSGAAPPRLRPIDADDHGWLIALLGSLPDEDPRRLLIRRKLRASTPMPRWALPVEVATLGSRVVFSIGHGAPCSRTIVPPERYEPTGLWLAADSPFGLALLGMRAGEHQACTTRDGSPETLRLLEVHRRS